MLLRIVVGWHFLYQGIWKLNHPEFSSDAFLRNAKGPWATEFRQLIPDVDGRERLADSDAPFARWKEVYNGFLTYYPELTNDQKIAAEAALTGRQSQWKKYYEEISPDVKEYFIALDRWQSERAKASSWVDYEQKRLWQRRQELDGKVKPWLEELKSLETALHNQLVGLLDENQRNKPLPVVPPTQLDLVNKLVLYSNIAIGACLIAGLLTRLSAFGGFLFLGLIVAASPEWPTFYPPPHPSAGHSLLIDKNVVELAALWVLVWTPAGCWAGLDFFLDQMFFRRRDTGPVAQPVVRTVRTK